MLGKVEVSCAGKVKVDDNFKKYAEKRLGKLDKYLPGKARKGATMRVVVREVNRPHGNKYEIAVTLSMLGGKTIVAKDEAANTFAGVDILEAKLAGQIRKYKLQETPHQQRGKRGILRKLLFKAK